MKLYLSSLSIPDPDAYLGLFNNRQNIRVAVITNAWGVYPVGINQSYIDEIKNIFKKIGAHAENLDLLEYQDKQDGLVARLTSYDGVWVTGGNSYYLNWAIHRSGLQKIICKLCDEGYIYGGESAGAIVAGPTLNYFQTADDPNDAPDTILEGMGLTDIAVVPHFNNPKYSDIMQNILLQLQQSGYNAVTLNDDQALVIDGARKTIVLPE